MDTNKRIKRAVERQRRTLAQRSEQLKEYADELYRRGQGRKGDRCDSYADGLSEAVSAIDCLLMEIEWILSRPEEAKSCE